MKNKNWYVIGVMSGTSLDGVDLVYVKISKNIAYSFKILEKITINYSDLWKKNLQDAFNFSEEKLKELDIEYGKFLGEMIHNFMINNHITKVNFIASHGHTVFHKPKQGLTLQIGSGAEIAKECKLKVICDFRTQDVALGGQGAPLVPIGDLLFFNQYDFCLNLGGFANISFQKDEHRVAFDICAVNIVLNHYTRSIGLEFDDKGSIASEGKLHMDLLHELNNLPFFLGEIPKSLGYEFIVDTILPLMDQYDLAVEDILRTFIEHAAFQISEVINRNFKFSSKTDMSVLVTGGGAFNDFLIQRIKHLSKSKIIIPPKDIIDFKEALVFALLGVLKAEGEVNCLQSVTGATKDHSSGVVFYPEVSDSLDAKT
jgi:anhydro-N-acetylmuramic acid kinase